ncbi:MAG: hypothetical protein ACU837_09465 [Gammaproteobacteria bacterium]
MIGGLVTILVAIWFFRSAVEFQKPNAMLWAAIGAVLFFTVQYALVWMNVFYIDMGMNETTSMDRSLTDVGDRVTSKGSSSFLKVLANVYYELFPIILGFLAAAAFRILVITKQKITVQNLFSGLKEIFPKIDLKKELKK